MATPGIRPIETHYKGYRFRSRLEARWAVFFDELGLRWDYEKQGYHLPSGPYLPDFWLPTLKCWVEVKPDAASAAYDSRASKLCAELAASTEHAVYLFQDLPPGYDFTGDDFERWGESGYYFCDEGWDNFRAFCVCEKCGAVGIEYQGWSERINCCGRDGKKCSTYDHPRIVDAVRASWGARFEHGENPRF